MAKDPQLKKRKASMPEVDAEKTKPKKIKNTSTPAESVEAPAKKRKATEDAAPVKVKKTKTPKPVVEEPVEPESKDNEEAEPAAAKKANGTKESTKSKKGAAKDVTAEAKSKSKPTAKAVKTVKVEAAKPNGKPEITVESEDEEEEDSDIDDQTEALLKGFESDGDEDDALNEEGLPEGESVPERKQLSKAEEKKLKKIAESGASDKPGVIYIGRIPHGFFEHEMRAYFKQFGNIINLRLSRNKKNGNSKHYGWIQFESATVADIVARTMDNYLMFGHLLKVKLIPDEQVHENLFKGANKRFKKVPWNKMEGRKIGQGASEDVWDDRVEREEKRRDEKAKKLQAIGYEFETPKVKSAKGVSKKKVAAIEPADVEVDEVLAIEAAPAIEEPSKSKKKVAAIEPADVEVDEVLAIEAAPAIEEPSKSKKKAKKATKPEVDSTKVDENKSEEKSIETVTKKKKKASAPPPVEDIEEEVAPVTAEKSQKSKKKQSKVKVAEVIESIDEERPVVAPEESTEPKGKKGKKAKKGKVDEIVTPADDDDAELVKAKPKVKKGKKGKKETMAV